MFSQSFRYIVLFGNYIWAHSRSKHCGIYTGPSLLERYKSYNNIYIYKAAYNKMMNHVIFFLVMPPTLKKWGGILVSACPYVCTYVRIHVRDIVLKLHVWIPHGKIANAYFWFSLNYLPLSNYGPLTNKGMKFCKCHISKSIIARNLKLVSADRG